ncbi:MAG TPA: YggT family protein [Acidimicrobiales bacterium]|nr:YggT family protein [Acidimicrobiales bacterium]
MSGNPVCFILNAYLIAIFGRILLSWFPISPDSPLASVFSVLYSITEPVLGPLRRVIPPIGGGLDISPIVVIFGMQILMRTVGC